MIKNQVFSVLQELGFVPEELAGYGYRFEYDGLILYAILDEDDPKYINVSAPEVWSVTDENRGVVLEVMLKLCNRLKYVQPQIMFDDEVWLSYQHYTDDHELTASLLAHIIRTVAFSTVVFHKIIAGDGSDN